MAKGSLTFLGTGTSTGVPMIGCGCEVCLSSDPRDKRLRSSVWIKSGGVSVLIDTATDFRTQALRAGIDRLDAVLYTHHHADHIHGIDELRSFNFLQRRSIACYGPRASLERIKNIFGYIFDTDAIDEGGGRPSLELFPVEERFAVDGLDFTPIPVRHGRIGVYGYRVGDTAYVTDCSEIPESSKPLMEGVNTLILGALGLKRHDTHFTVEKALEVIAELKPAKAYLTHLNHNIGYESTMASLPEGVGLAWDGLEIDI